MPTDWWCYSALLALWGILLFCYRRRTPAPLHHWLILALAGLLCLGLVVMCGNFLHLPLVLNTFTVAFSAIFGPAGVVGLLVFCLL